ncbi:MAG: GNAT family N-acetyltransferase [Alphaproteobacteria bacterium]|nr:GNAT family N-acetyltransferase [Alphaproteobacteria bacterium]
MATKTNTAGVRAAVTTDSAALSQTLAQAFHDDPMMCHLLSDPATRPVVMPRLFRVLFKLSLPYGACDVTDGYEAASLWRPPGQWHVHWWQYITNGPQLLRVFGAGVGRVMATMDVVERQHPKEPHWYLQVIGTDPEQQGKGFAGKLMRRRLEVVDAENMPAYLESSKETNIPIYRNFGFEVTGEIKIADGPTLWPMWRPARR